MSSNIIPVRQKESNVQDVCKLSPAQEGILFHSLYEEDSKIYFVQNAYFIKQELDTEMVKESLRILFDRHDILRSSFLHDLHTVPVRVVLKKREPLVIFKDVHGKMGQREKLAYFKKFAEKDSDIKFNLVKDTLLRLSILKFGEKDYGLIWSHHHILFDGWSTNLLIRDFQEIYSRRCKGALPSLPEPGSYSSYTGWIERQDKNLTSRYWKTLLKGYKGGKGISIVKDNYSKNLQKIPTSHSFDLNENVSMALAEFAKKNRVTLNTIIRCAFGILVAKLNNSEDIVFGAVVSNRPKEVPRVENIMGLMINTIPVRIQYSADTIVKDLLQTIQKNSIESDVHQYYSLAEIKAESGIKDDFIDHLLTFENYPEIPQNNTSKNKLESNGIFDALSIKRREQNNYDFTIIFFPGKEISARINYNSQCFNKETIKRIECRFRHLIDQIFDSEMKISAITVFDNQDQVQILERFNVRRPLTPLKSLMELFNSIVLKQPNAPAVKMGSQIYTYRELDEASDKLGSYLRFEMGATKGSLVGIMMETNPLLLVAMLGIWKARCAFVPIDIQSPVAKKQNIFSDSKINHLITDSNSILQLDSFEGNIIALDIQLDSMGLGPANDEIEKRNPSDVAYVIYTSGSTGRPKGVIIEDESLVNYINWLTYFCDLGPSDQSLLLSSYAFDLGYTSIWGMLFNGGVLHLTESSLKTHPESVLPLFKNEHISFLKLTPSILSILMTLPDFPSQNFNVGTIMLGGEKIVYKELKKFMVQHPKCKIINHYGPTETTIGTLAWKIGLERVDQFEHQSIVGNPISGNGVYITDDQGNLCPVGVFGEICVKGKGMARGYLNDPLLTDERFINSSWKNYERVYKTGDVGRFLSNGKVEITGRKDRQVKIRGFRVELGEIEKVILDFPGVAKVAVLNAAQNGLCDLVCFIQGEAIDLKRFESFLKNHLVDYMIPSAIEVLGQFPMNENGKVDIRRLLFEHRTQRKARTIMIQPESPEEVTLVDLWKEVLEREEICVQDNFFELGGHSLRAVQIVSGIFREFKIKVGVETIFNNPTIRGLSQVLRKAIPQKTNMEFSRIEEQAYYKVSHGQLKIWMVEQMDENTPVFTIVKASLLKGELNYENLDRAFKMIVAQHEILRTSFFQDETDNICQRVHIVEELDVKLEIEQIDLPNFAIQQKVSFSDYIEKERQKAFYLDRAPLIRLKLLIDPGQPNHHLLVLSIHHIITDFNSSAILIKELCGHYDSMNRSLHKVLQPLNFHYKDYTAWENKRGNGNNERIVEYWMQKLKGKHNPRIDLRTDFPRPAVQSYHGKSYYFSIGGESYRVLDELAKTNQVTTFTVFLTLVKVMFLKYTRDNSILIGTPLSKRDFSALDNQIGFYLNIMVIFSKINPEVSFIDLMQQVNTNYQEARSHHLPFDFLVEKLGIRPNLQKNPLIDIGLDYVQLGQIKKVIEVGGLEVTHIENTYASVKTDLWFNVEQSSENLYVKLDYARDLFRETTISQMAQKLVTLLEEIGKNPQRSVREILIKYDLQDEEKNKKDRLKIKEKNLQKLTSK